MRGILRQLTYVQRESLVLAYYGGFSQSQIAEILGTPLGTVKTRMRDGLGRLRDRLTAEAGPGRRGPAAAPLPARAAWAGRPGPVNGCPLSA